MTVDEVSIQISKFISANPDQMITVIVTDWDWWGPGMKKSTDLLSTTHGLIRKHCTKNHNHSHSNTCSFCVLNLYDTPFTNIQHPGSEDTLGAIREKYSKLVDKFRKKSTNPKIAPWETIIDITHLYEGQEIFSLFKTSDHNLGNLRQTFTRPTHELTMPLIKIIDDHFAGIKL